jgi:4-diphosphocytidyl-2-C-methyl-D-erythritol kinase
VIEIREPAPAKLNLFLHILGRRADGYHLLDGLVSFADIGDEVTAAPAPTLGLASGGPFVQDLPQPQEANLVWRAALLLADRLGIPPKAGLSLTKNLPVASGIGGGSSDAAAALRALARLWKAPLDAGALAALAARLGADVPVCIDLRDAWLGGVGEILEPAGPLPAAGVVLANPGVALPTADVYRAFRGPYSVPARFSAPADAGELAALLRTRRNDLTGPASSIVPAIHEVLAQLQATTGALIARMSGSGATCFALYRSRDDAMRAAWSLAGERPKWWVKGGALLAKPGGAHG